MCVSVFFFSFPFIFFYFFAFGSYLFTIMILLRAIVLAWDLNCTWFILLQLFGWYSKKRNGKKAHVYVSEREKKREREWKKDDLRDTKRKYKAAQWLPTAAKSTGYVVVQFAFKQTQVLLSHKAHKIIKWKQPIYSTRHEAHGAYLLGMENLLPFNAFVLQGVC